MKKIDKTAKLDFFMQIGVRDNSKVIALTVMKPQWRCYQG
jgi:hypothetical protein